MMTEPNPEFQQKDYGQPQGYPPKFHADFREECEHEIKKEQEESADILDLDSQNVVRPGGDENELFEYGTQHNGPNPYSFSAMLSWPDRCVYSHTNDDSQEHKMYSDWKPFVHQEKNLYRPLGDYQAGPSSTRPDILEPSPSSSQDIHQQNTSYGLFESQISSSQATNSSTGSIPKSDRKSRKTRRPKIYNCSPCNKWFTTSGHLKRHYGTNLHKNSVRSSGKPDPATLPINTHLQPTRDPSHSSNREQSSNAGDQNTESPEDSQAGSRFDQTPHSGVSQDIKSSYIHHPNNQPLGNYNYPLVNYPPPYQNSHYTSHHSQGVPTDQSNSLNNSAGNSFFVSINNGISPLVAHNLPPFVYLPTNTYNAPGLTGQDPPSLYLTQTEQNLSPNHQNTMSSHFMDTASDTIGIGEVTADDQQQQRQISYEQSHLLHYGTESFGPLPSFAQFQTQHYEMILPDFPTMGGSIPCNMPVVSGHNAESAYTIGDESTQNYQEPKTYENYIDKSEDDKSSLHNHLLLSTTIVDMHTNKPPKEEYITGDLSLIHDSSNKENCEPQAGSPSSPIVRTEYENNGSPSVSSTVMLPLATSNKRSSKADSNVEYKCYECDKLFNRPCYLTQHNRTFHCGVKPFKCERCGKRFESLVAYEKHYSKHAGDKPFKCGQCPKQFNYRTDLRRHMCLHDDEKPHSCNICGKGFVRKDHMLKHRELHRKKSK